MRSTRERSRHSRAWEDWAVVDPYYAVLTDPGYHRGRGDIDQFLASGRDTVTAVLRQTDQLGIGSGRETALDFGCGVGRLTWALAEQFGIAVGLDISPTMIRRARELHAGLPNCRFALCASPDLGAFDEGSFDLVVCLLVLQHLPGPGNIESCLRELLRVLRPGGAAVVQLPAKVPSALPTGPWWSPSGARTRLASGLRGAGVDARVLYTRLSWSPEMTMTALAHERACDVVADAGGEVAHLWGPDVDPKGTESRIYFITR